jgi:DNA segregation ATPase FtsK/SpoIIIE-like protein
MALARQRFACRAEPIAGKGARGSELPTYDRWFACGILDDRRWEKHSRALPMALSRDIGEPAHHVDLAFRMPHLLVRRDRVRL